MTFELDNRIAAMENELETLRSQITAYEGGGELQEEEEREEEEREEEEREEEEERHKAAARELADGDDDAYLGHLQERRYFHGLLVSKIHSWFTPQGRTTFVLFEDTKKRQVIWRATNSPDLYKGDIIECKATVKGHIPYKGTPQTVVSRASNIKLLRTSPFRP